MYTKQQIIEEIRRIAEKLDVGSLKKRDFERHSKISSSSVRYHFGTWNEAIREAGLTPIDSTEIISKKELIDDNDLLLDLIRLYNEYSKEPTWSLVNAKGKYSTKPYKDRWKNIKVAFSIAKQRFPDRILPNIQKSDTDGENIKNIKVIPQTIKQRNGRKRRIILGELIDFRGLRFAPVNEQGVVYLFGMVAHELGFLIESIRTEYPDCEGKRCFDKAKSQWEHVKIEFEYKSSQFKEHGHSEDDCDIIVCWIDDCNNCPIEVLELRSAIKYL
jgi:hypothetical protein